MNFEKYENKLPYPYGVTLTNDERLAREKYHEETRRMKALFKQDLLEEFGLVGHKKAEKFFSLAWEYGHASGYAEVYSYAQELVELL
jgi:hypothetical protein